MGCFLVKSPSVMICLVHSIFHDELLINKLVYGKKLNLYPLSSSMFAVCRKSISTGQADTTSSITEIDCNIGNVSHLC